MDQLYKRRRHCQVGFISYMCLGDRQTFVRTVSLRMELGSVASFRRAPERTFPDRFLPVKSHCRRSRILSETAFACRAHT